MGIEVLQSVTTVLRRQLGISSDTTELDLDGSNSIDPDTEVVDTDGDGRASDQEVWDFFEARSTDIRSSIVQGTVNRLIGLSRSRNHNIADEAQSELLDIAENNTSVAERLLSGLMRDLRNSPFHNLDASGIDLAGFSPLETIFSHQPALLTQTLSDLGNDLASPARRTRLQAAQTLQRLIYLHLPTPTLRAIREQFLAGLDSADPEIYLLVAVEISDFSMVNGSSLIEMAVPYLQRNLTSSASAEKRRALYAFIGNIYLGFGAGSPITYMTAPSPFRPLIPLIVADLRSSETILRVSSSYALAGISSNDPEALINNFPLAALRLSLRDTDLQTRVNAAYVIGQVGRINPNLVRATIPDLQHNILTQPISEPGARPDTSEFSLALFRVGLTDPSVVDSTISALIAQSQRGATVEQRVIAINALGILAARHEYPSQTLEISHVQPALNELVARLNDAQPQVSRATIDTLTYPGMENDYPAVLTSSIPIFIRMINSNNQEMRRNGLKGLSRLFFLGNSSGIRQQAISQSISRVDQLLNDPTNTNEVRLAAAETLLIFMREDSSLDSLPRRTSLRVTLMDILEHGSVENRRIAVQLLENPLLRSVIVTSRLLRSLNDSDAEVRANACYGLAWVPTTETIVNALITRMMRDTSSSVRFSAGMSLGHILNEIGANDPLAPRIQRALREANRRGLSTLRCP